MAVWTALRSRPLAISLVLHTGGLVALAWLHGRSPHTTASAVEVTLRHHEAPAPPTVAPRLPAAPSPPVSERSRPSSPRSDPVRRRVDPVEPTSSSDGRDGAPPSDERAAAETPAPAAPGGTINLFPTAMLERQVAASAPARPNWGGTTRRAGDGRPPPGERDPSLEREEAAARIRGWVDDMTGRERVRAGNVPPAWRDAERGITAAFAPPPQLVSDDGAARTFIDQWRRAKPESGPTPRALDPAADAGNERYEQMMAGQSATGAPAGWLCTEVEVVVAADGTLASARVVHSSGRRKLDAAALAAVEAALAGRSLRDPRGKVVARWSVEAAVTAAPPTGLKLSFDETTGKVGGRLPFQKSVRTRVVLVSLSPVAG